MSAMVCDESSSPLLGLLHSYEGNSLPLQRPNYLAEKLKRRLQILGYLYPWCLEVAQGYSLNVNILYGLLGDL